MDKNDIKMVAHIGAEVLLIGGLSFYFQNKLSKQAEKIENLEKHIAQLLNAVEMHEQALKQLYGVSENEPVKKSSKSSKVPAKKGISFSNKPQAKPKASPPPPPEEPEEEEEIGFDEDELDEEIEEELVSPPEDDDQEIEEDAEDLKNSKNSKKNGKK